MTDEEKVPLYGFPCVSDPNDFSPDAECCSPEEIAAHKRACETYGTPDYEPNKGCYSEHDAEGNLVKHVTRTSWGIGVNMIPASWMNDPEPCEKHVWVSQRMGGDPTEAGSAERVTYCEVCGIEPDDEMLELPLSADAVDPQVTDSGKPSTRVEDSSSDASNRSDE